MDNSAIMCDEVIESQDEGKKAIPTNFNKKKAACKTKILYTLLAFLLITLALLIAISIYCYLIKIKKCKNVYYNFRS